MKLKHEVNDTPSGFSHKLVVADATGKTITEGPAAGYKGVASLKFNGAWYGIATEYFEGDLPINEPFQIIPLKEGLL